MVRRVASRTSSVPIPATTMSAALRGSAVGMRIVM